VSRAELQSAIAAHGLWKVRLRQAVRGDGSGPMLDVATARADDLCEFGQWLYGVRDPELVASVMFEEVRELHSECHRVSAEVLRSIAEGRHGEAAEAIGHRGCWTQASVALTSRLLDWQKGIAPSPFASH
jgi:hypothetical protein